MAPGGGHRHWQQHQEALATQQRWQQQCSDSWTAAGIRATETLRLDEAIDEWLQHQPDAENWAQCVFCKDLRGLSASSVSVGGTRSL